MGRFGEVGIGAGSALVAGGDEDGDALSDGGLVGSSVGLVGGCAIFGLGLAVADGDDLGWVAGVDEVVEGDQATEGGLGVGAGGELDGGAGAAAEAHSASRMASPSAPFAPGPVQLPGWTCVKLPEVYWLRPKVLRKVVQSAAE